MKKYLLTLLLFFGVGVVNAQPLMRLKARSVLHRTAIAIYGAKKELQADKHYTGNFARAVAHQRFARRMFLRRNFLRAIHQSRLARRFAFALMKENNRPIPAEWEFTSEENDIAKDENMSDDDLYREMKSSNNDVKLDDEELLNADLSDLDQD